jgi:flavin reductase (DIM6/NTAB) family NADH-FMN oxidoreductase RutF
MVKGKQRARLTAGAKEFDAVVAGLDVPMVVVTVAAGGERSGCLVGFHSQSSIDPIRYCVWISKANHTHGVIVRATHFAVHFLSDQDHDLAELFGGSTGDTVDKFADVDLSVGAGETPIINRCSNILVARRTALFDEGGDHVCVMGEPVEVEFTPFVPLRISRVADVTPGHAADDLPA